MSPCWRATRHLPSSLKAMFVGGRSPLQSRVWLFRLVIIASFCGDPGRESGIRGASRRQGRAQSGPGAR